MLQNIFNATLNTIFVSVPEELVWTICVLILLKRRDLLDIYRWKHNLKELMIIVVIPVAISINVMKYILHVNNLINFITIEIMFCILMIYLIKRNNFLNEKINYVKIIFYVILADMVMNFIVECLYVLLLTMLNVNVVQIDNIYISILLSWFPRTIQILIIVFYLYKKNVDPNIKFIELILKDKVLGISLSTFLLTLITIFYIISRFIVINSVFIKYAIIYQIIFNLSIILTPIILTISFIIPICHLLVKNIETQKTIENMFFDD